MCSYLLQVFCVVETGNFLYYKVRWRNNLFQYARSSVAQHYLISIVLCLLNYFFICSFVRFKIERSKGFHFRCLKVRAMLFSLQGGFTKYCSFLCMRVGRVTHKYYLGHIFFPKLTEFVFLKSKVNC